MLARGENGVRLISVGYRLVNRTGREATGAVSYSPLTQGGLPLLG